MEKREVMENKKPEWFVYQLNRHDFDGDLDITLFENFGSMIEQEKLDLPNFQEQMFEYYNVKQITELFETEKDKISVYVGEYEGFGTALLTMVDIAKMDEIRAEYNNDPMVLFDVSGIKVLFGIDPESGIEWVYVKTEDIEKFVEAIHNADIW